jgi:tryptophan synthase alpha subunit
MNKAAEIIKNIKICNDSGRLALAVYLIHGYPSLEVSKRAFDLLQTHNTTIIECGLPVAFFSGSNMSTTIKDAHSIASQIGLSDEELLSFYACYRPNLLIHLQDEQREEENILLKQIQGSIDAVMTDNIKFASILNQPSQDKKLPLLVQFVSAFSAAPERDFIVRPDTLVYLGVASRTGGELLPSEQIQYAVNAIAKTAPDAKILCGLGIRTARDVIRLRRIRGIHGIAIGTEAMFRLKEGITDFENWLLQINCELFWEV